MLNELVDAAFQVRPPLCFQTGNVVGMKVEEMVLGSPFDWLRQAALYTPSGLPDPRDPGGQR